LQSSMINMLARLGWSKGEKEIFYLKDLLADFRIQEVQKAGAIFDPAKLDWINNNHLAALSFDNFKLQLIPFLAGQNIDLNTKENSDAILQAMRTSKPTLAGIALDLKPYFFAVEAYNEKAVNKFLAGSNETLEFTQRKLQALEIWDEASIDLALSDVQATLALPTPKLNQPIRIAMTGSTQSPSLGLTLSLFGKEETYARIQNAIKFLEESAK